MDPTSLPGDLSELHLRISYDDQLRDIPQADTLERWKLSECLVDGAHRLGRSAVLGGRVALGLVREDRSGSVERFEELGKGLGCRPEVVEP
ncbi:hypothetical protein [Streptomyces sp. AM8-1-1]|uniref:hypothetical protein n=1 Tax=Streptomyces sp. AM8-1-1 TaxID=3075825 RepID=UPI0028C43612|nr:hypothetical protein [Streptomyces sp. AM8-1-1]WNO71816.1 hypothetical protein RPQ07_09270 [Streptomyces sp. AM8-1-1]